MPDILYEIRLVAYYRRTEGGPTFEAQGFWFSYETAFLDGPVGLRNLFTLVGEACA